MITFTQNQIVDIIVEKLTQFSTGSKKGTYDKSDPTCYEKHFCKIGMQYGFGPAVEEACGCPESENVEVEIHDVTWGIEFKINAPSGKHEGYWSRSFPPSNKSGFSGHWTRCSPDFLKVLKRLFLEGEEPQNFDDESEDDGTMTNPNANE